jgi:hypothetical protein
VEVLVCKAVENVQVLEAEKKSAWTDLDQVNFEKKSSMSKCSHFLHMMNTSSFCLFHRMICIFYSLIKWSPIA